MIFLLPRRYVVRRWVTHVQVENVASESCMVSTSSTKTLLVSGKGLEQDRMEGWCVMLVELQCLRKYVESI